MVPMMQKGKGECGGHKQRKHGQLLIFVGLVFVVGRETGQSVIVFRRTRISPPMSIEAHQADAGELQRLTAQAAGFVLQLTETAQVVLIERVFRRGMDARAGNGRLRGMLRIFAGCQTPQCRGDLTPMGQGDKFSRADVHKGSLKECFSSGLFSPGSRMLEDTNVSGKYDDQLSLQAQARAELKVGPPGNILEASDTALLETANKTLWFGGGE